MITSDIFRVGLENYLCDRFGYVGILEGSGCVRVRPAVFSSAL
jgi:hypothetical protein